MEERKYKITAIIYIVLFPPAGFYTWILFNNWKKNKTQENQLKLEKSIISGLRLIFFQLIVLSLLFYHFGRMFLPVMGTFY